MLAWRLHRKLIPVDEVLKKQGLTLVSKCVCCQHEETLDHVFFTNVEAAKVWKNLANLFGIAPNPILSLQNALTNWSLSVNQGHVRRTVPLITLWALWEARNLKKHENTPYNCNRITSRVCNFLFLTAKSKLYPYSFWKGDLNVANYFHARVLKPPKKTATLVKWNKPKEGFLKLNIDGSFGLQSSASGGILRDKNGRLIVAFSNIFFALSPLEAEVKAVYYSLIWCREHNYNQLQVEVDSSQIISCIHKQQGNWKIHSYLLQIIKLLQLLRADISHVFREANKCADFMAKKAGREAETFIWGPAEAPKELKALILLEQQEIPYIRR